ncbi:LysR family transcriptional regulator [Caballeronia arationis]|nr:LysR family transcriptional regulator [Caballeronia arationis]
MLEERLGVRLIQRSTRHFTVTEIGRVYYAHCKAMLIEAEAAQEAIDVTRSEVRGVVRLTFPVALLHTTVGAMIGEFMFRNPQVVVHLEATNRRVDVIAEGIDVAIRVRFPPLTDSDLVMKVLGNRTWCLAASPTLTRQYLMPVVPADLSGLPSLDLGAPQQEHIWELQGPGGVAAAIRHTPRLVTDDMIALRQAAAAGAGVVQLPTMMLKEDIANGTLQQLLPDWAPRSGIIHAVFPSRLGLIPAVRELIDFLAARFDQASER